MQAEEMIGRVDDETVRSLMESASYLANICKNNNVDVDLNDLPHCKRLRLYQIEQLKSLMKDS